MSIIADTDTEVTVNTYKQNPQILSKLVKIPGGTAQNPTGWIVLWVSNGQDGSDGGVYFQVYNADGSKYGPETKVNTTVTGHQSDPDIVFKSGGDFVVTWQSYDNTNSSGSNIFQQRFLKNIMSEQYIATGAEIAVNAAANDQTDPAIALRTGGTVVVWTHENADGTTDILQKLYKADGTVQTVGMANQTVVNATVAGNQAKPTVTGLANGQYVVTWETPDANGTGIAQQLFKADGTVDGQAVQVNTTTTGNQVDAKVLELSGGGWVTFYNNGTDLLFQRFDANGTKAGAETKVGSDGTANSYSGLYNDVIALDSGGFMVVWSDTDDIHVRNFNASGVPQGSASKNFATWRSPYECQITKLAGNRYVVTYETGLDGSNSNSGIYQQVIDQDGNKIGGEFHVNSESSA